MENVDLSISHAHDIKIFSAVTFAEHIYLMTGLLEGDIIEFLIFPGEFKNH